MVLAPRDLTELEGRLHEGNVPCGQFGGQPLLGAVADLQVAADGQAAATK
jgi:hypothetical protein